MATPSVLRLGDRGRLALTWAAIGTLASFVLSLWTLHGLRRVGTNDALWYLEHARTFATHWPTRAGDDFPFGYPLLVSLGVRVGVPAYFAACGISLLALFVVLLLIQRYATTSGHIGALAAAVVPGVLFQAWAPLSDMTFAALILAVAVLLAHWPHRGAIAASVALAVAAVFVRYVGAFLAPVLVIWFCLSYRSLRASKTLPWTVGCGAVGIAVAVSGCVLNITQTGHLTGERALEPHFWAALPRHAVEFALAPVTFFSSRLATTVLDSGVAPLVAIILVALGGILLVPVLRRPASQYSRPMALLVVGYALFALLLRGAYTDTERLWFARFLVPAWFPLVWLALERDEAWAPAKAPTLVARALSLVLAVAGIAQAVRGLSAEMYGEVERALPAFERFVPAGSLVMVNDRALEVAAYFDDRRFIVGGNKDQADALVVAADVTDRRGSFRAYSEGAQIAASSAIEAGWKVVYSSDEVIVCVRPR